MFGAYQEPVQCRRQWKTRVRFTEDCVAVQPIGLARTPTDASTRRRDLRAAAMLFCHREITPCIDATPRREETRNDQNQNSATMKMPIIENAIAILTATPIMKPIQAAAPTRPARAQLL